MLIRRRDLPSVGQVKINKSQGPPSAPPLRFLKEVKEEEEKEQKGKKHRLDGIYRGDVKWRDEESGGVECCTCVSNTLVLRRGVAKTVCCCVEMPRLSYVPRGSSVSGGV